MNVTIGCDPELFLFDNIKQRIVPAIGKIGGSKHKPLSLVGGGMVQLDGTVLEFGTAPATSGEDFVSQIQSTINQIRTKLDNRFHGRYELRCGALAGYSPEDIDEDHIGLNVGCSPQYRFTSDNALEVVGGVSKLDRSAIPVGGHIHVGFGCNLPITDERLVVSAARFTELFHQHMPQFIANDRCMERQGILGIEHEAVVRIKPYGLEYRNMPSYWLADKGLCSLLYQLTYYVAQTLSGMDFSGMLTVLENQLDRRMTFVESAAEAVPAKYQNTLPLDF